MKSIISIYDRYDKAIATVEALKNNGFSSKHLSLLNKVNEQQTADSENVSTALKGLGIGATVGTVGGVLTGVGLLAIPGLGFLVGAGALAGAVAGFDIGMIGSGIITALTIGGLNNEAEQKYQQELEEGKTLLIIQGTEEELNKARPIVEKQGGHLEMNVH